MCPSGWKIVSEYYQTTAFESINAAVDKQDLKGLKTAIKKLGGFDEAKLNDYLAQFTAAAKAAPGGKLDLASAVKMVAGN